MSLAAVGLGHARVLERKGIRCPLGGFGRRGSAGEKWVWVGDTHQAGQRLRVAARRCLLGVLLDGEGRVCVVDEAGGRVLGKAGG